MFISYRNSVLPRRSGNSPWSAFRPWSRWTPTEIPCTGKCSPPARPNSPRGCSSVSRLHRPARLHQPLVAPYEREDISITHALGGVGREGGAITAPAIHDDLRVGIRNHFVQVALQNALAQMHGLHGMADRPLAILPHVQQHRLRILRQAMARGLDGDFLDARARFIDQFQKAGRMIHVATHTEESHFWQARLTTTRDEAGCRGSSAGARPRSYSSTGTPWPTRRARRKTPCWPRHRDAGSAGRGADWGRRGRVWAAARIRANADRCRRRRSCRSVGGFASHAPRGPAQCRGPTGRDNVRRNYGRN